MERKIIKGFILMMAVIAGCSFPAGLQGQAFERTVVPSAVLSNRGPNRLHFSHVYLGASLIPPAPMNGTGTSDTGLSSAFTGGFRYKIKLMRPLALVGEVGLVSQGYRIKPGSSFLPGDTVSFRKQTVLVAGIDGGIFLRLRLGQRGNYLGNYIDIGLQGMMPLLSSQITVSQNTGSGTPTHSSEKRTFHRLNCMQPYSFSTLARIGFNRTALVISWRLSGLTDGSTSYDLPRLQIGVETALVSY